MDWLSVVLVLLFFIAVLYLYGTWTYDYWEKLNVIYEKPKYPFFGNTFDTAFSKKSNHTSVLDIYTKYRGNKFVGTFSFRRPSLFILDPDLIQSFLIKDFNFFYNRAINFDPELDPLSEHLVNVKDTKWKTLRNKLTPTFSSGKLKGMHQQLLDCTDSMIKLLNKNENKSIDIRELMQSFAMDVIASCAFGLNIDVLNNSDSTFKKLGKKTFEASFTAKLRRSVRNHYPWLVSLLKWKSIPIELENFFIRTIKETLEYRKNNNVERHDFLHLMNELKKQDNLSTENTMVFNDNLLAANAFVFFVAGFETTASTLSFALYELTLNPDIQEKAYQNVRTAINKCNGLSPEAIKEMTYLDCIIKETLRRYPPISETTRDSTKAYQVPGTKLVLPKGSLVRIPIYALHHDPDYYPEPFKYNPDRFMEGKLKPGTFLPFGDGPRICIGMRFAETEIKVALAKILLEYELLPSKNTKTPIKFSPESSFLVPIGGIWMNIKKKELLNKIDAIYTIVFYQHCRMASFPI